jgi:hypothetical protein
MATLFPRLHQARMEAAGARILAHHARIQRNALRDQRDRLLVAVATINYLRAADVSDRRMGQAVADAMALLKVATEYDRIQVLSDPSYESDLLIQENRT